MQGQIHRCSSLLLSILLVVAHTSIRCCLLHLQAGSNTPIDITKEQFAKLLLGANVSAVARASAPRSPSPNLSLACTGEFIREERIGHEGSHPGTPCWCDSTFVECQKNRWQAACRMPRAR